MKKIIEKIAICVIMVIDIYLLYLIIKSFY